MSNRLIGSLLLIALLIGLVHPSPALADDGKTVCAQHELFGQVHVVCTGGQSQGAKEPVSGGVVVVPECVPTVDAKGNTVPCLTPIPRPPTDPGVSAEVAARSAATRLAVPEPVIRFGPEPSVNRWNVMAVGYPIWVWLDETGPVDSSVTQDGIAIDLVASRGAVKFDWGDGTTTVCMAMRPRPPRLNPPLTPSPDCGHTYLKAGDYTVTATATWDVTWRSGGHNGALELAATASRPLPIREFKTVVVG